MKDKKTSGAKAARTKRINSTIAATIEKMEAMGVYKTEFDDTIRRYAEVVDEYETQYPAWIEDGAKLTVMIPNSSGLMVEKKNPVYAAIQEIRTEIRNCEDKLGLSPKALQAMKKKGLDSAKASALDIALQKMMT